MTQLSRSSALVVEDEPAIRAGIERMLERLGYTAQGVGTAAEALDALKGGTFDVILVDINLPDASGHFIMGASDRRPPVIAMSAAATVDDLVLVLRRRAVDFLDKPFKLSDLEAALRRAREQSAARLEAPFNLADSEAAKVRATEEEGGALPSAPPAIEPRAADDARPALERLKDQIRDETLALPVRADLLERLQELLRNETVGADDLVLELERDPVVSGQVLRLANSGYYRRARSVDSLRDACVVLGNKRVLSLAQEVALSQLFQLRTPPWDSICEAMWLNVTVTAMGARRLAEQLDFQDPEEVFLSALFHNIGEVVLLHGFCALAPPLEEGMPMGFDDFARLAEKRHERVGGRLLRSWGCPPATVKLARQHHPSSYRPQMSPEAALSACVMAAWHGAIRAGFHYFGGREPAHPMSAERRLRLTQRTVDAVFKDAHEWSS